MLKVVFSAFRRYLADFIAIPDNTCCSYDNHRVISISWNCFQDFWGDLFYKGSEILFWPYTYT